MESVGAFLRTIREEKALRLEEIAQSTKIAKKHLEAIERDQLELLPGEAYQRIFVRAYAQELGISHEELDKVLAESRDKEKGKASPSSTQKSKRYLELVFAGAGLLLGIVVVLILAQNSDSKTDAQTDAQTEKSLAAIKGLPLATVNLPDSSRSVRPAESLELKIEALGKTKAKVMAGSDTLFQGVLRPGQTNSWKSDGGFRLIVDQPKQVRVYLNDKFLEQFSKSDKSGLNLDITPENCTSLLENETKP